MDKIDTENELNFKVSNTTTKQTLIDENCCTILTISLTNSGDVFTTFLGAYNEDILKLLKRTQKQYYKNLLKKLKASEHAKKPNEASEPDADVEPVKEEVKEQVEPKKQTAKSAQAQKKSTEKKSATASTKKSASTSKTTAPKKKTTTSKSASAPAPKK